MLLGIIFTLVIAVVIGLAAKLYFGRNVETDPDDQASVPDLLRATALVGGLMLAIVISGSGASYTGARTAAKTEADAVDTLYESAEYADMPFRQNLHAGAVCYARAVVGPEWKTLAKGDRSPVPNNWTSSRPGGFRATLIEMTPKAQGFSLVQSADARRGDLRAERVTQANPTVPSPIILLMAVLISLSLGGLAYSVPRSGNAAHLVATAVVTLTFVVAMFLIYNLDRPFSGVLALKPTAMQAVEKDISEEYADAYKTELPCDETGTPRRTEAASAGPAATTTTLTTRLPATTSTTAPRTRPTTTSR